MDKNPSSIHKRTMKGRKLQYDYLHFDQRVVFTTIASDSAGRKYQASEVTRAFQKAPDLEIENYRHLLPRDGVPISRTSMDIHRVREHFSNFYTLHREIICSMEDNKSKRNILVKLRQMFNDDRFDTSIVYYTGAANKQGHWVIESQDSGEETIAFSNILEVWNSRTSKQKYLLIILESNYSGKWIKDLQAIKPPLEHISIAAACKDTEKALDSEFGGYYTHNLLKFLNKNSNENIVVTSQTPQFGGDYLACKKMTNLYLKFNSWQELSESQKSDFVLIDYENGTYIGHFLNAQKHFWGVFTWKTGVFKDCRYQGEFKGGRLHGRGILVYNNGRVYEGEFENNTPHGSATETYANKDKYVGQFANGYKNGKGVYYYANGEIYDGKFFDNKPHGPGTLKMPNGGVYEGNFAAGKCNGKGKFTYPNGDVYEGDWAHSVKSGKGVYSYANGNVYTGDFLNGMRHGFGKFVTNSDEAYEGMWENDLKSGDGVFTAKGQTFTGEWIKGKMAQTTKFFAKTGTQKLAF
jgi:hypothetical protein